MAVIPYGGNIQPNMDKVLDDGCQLVEYEDFPNIIGCITLNDNFC